MLTMTDAAGAHLIDLLGDAEAPEDVAIRFVVESEELTLRLDKERDGDEALRLSSRLCEGSGFRNGPHLMTLAASFAEVGKFDEAVATIDRATEIARGIGREELLNQLAATRERYLSGTPMRLNDGWRRSLPLRPGCSVKSTAT